MYQINIIHIIYICIYIDLYSRVCCLDRKCMDLLTPAINRNAKEPGSAARTAPWKCVSPLAKLAWPRFTPSRRHLGETCVVISQRKLYKDKIKYAKSINLTIPHALSMFPNTDFQSEPWRSLDNMHFWVPERQSVSPSFQGFGERDVFAKKHQPTHLVTCNI